VEPACTVILLYEWAYTLDFKEKLRTIAHQLCIWQGSYRILSRRLAKHSALLQHGVIMMHQLQTLLMGTHTFRNAKLMLRGQLCADLLEAVKHRCNTIHFMAQPPLEGKWHRIGNLLLQAKKRAEGRLTVRE
jgi:hypothetical protein